MSKEGKGKDRADKKSPLRSLKEKRADKANKRTEKNRKGLEDLKKL